MNRLCSICFVISILISFNLLAKKPVSSIPKIKEDQKVKELGSPWVGFISELEGKVVIKRYDSSGRKVVMIFQSEDGHLVHQKDELSVGMDSSMKIRLKDKSSINLAPKTIFRIHKFFVNSLKRDGFFDLLQGNVRVDIDTKRKDSSVRIYTPNTSIATDRSDFVLQYNEENKTTQIICFSKNVTVMSLTDSKGKKGEKQILKAGEYMKVETAFSEEGEMYISGKPKKFSRGFKKKVLASFHPAKGKEIHPWDYTTITTSFSRFSLGFEYERFSTQNFYNFTASYIPLVYLFSFVYLEPYFKFSIANFSLYHMSTGGRLQLHIWRGFYTGVGGGIFWVNRNISDCSGDINFNMGYTFRKKRWKILDSMRLSYSAIRKAGANGTALWLDIIFNIQRGREFPENN